MLTCALEFFLALSRSVRLPDLVALCFFPVKGLERAGLIKKKKTVKELLPHNLPKWVNNRGGNH